MKWNCGTFFAEIPYPKNTHIDRRIKTKWRQKDERIHVNFVLLSPFVIHHTYFPGSLQTLYLLYLFKMRIVTTIQCLTMKQWMSAFCPVYLMVGMLQKDIFLYTILYCLYILFYMRLNDPWLKLNSEYIHFRLFGQKDNNSDMNEEYNHLFCVVYSTL